MLVFSYLMHTQFYWNFQLELLNGCEMHISALLSMLLVYED